jgi:hypothetical protein
MSVNVMARCGHCGAVKRIPADEPGLHPSCGKCGSPIIFLEAPVTVTAANFDEGVSGMARF